MSMPPAKPNAWSTGLFNCCASPGGCGTCCFATCCGCCQYGQNLERMAAGEVCCGANNCGACCCFYMLGGFIPTITAILFTIPVPLSCSCIVHTGAREWIRTKYGIPGNGCQDCLITTFCIPCALCQEHRELVIRGVGIGGVEMQKVTAVAPVIVVAAPPPVYPANVVVPGVPVPPPAEHHEKKKHRHSSSSSDEE